MLKPINLDIYEREFLTLLGSSGCGKTTTLRIIAGFETATEGQVYIEGEEVTDKAPYDRNVNTVFQSYALFPHMNVFDNVAFGLVEKKVDKKEIKKRVNEILELVQLEGFAKRRPSQMSGGQKQRVAIARALVNNPKVLLLDEPLGALDLKLRKQMQVELKHLQKKLGITFIYVTHDQEEALTMSDRIVIMNKGRLEQIGDAREIYEKPKSRFVADFIGESNIMEGYIDKAKGRSDQIIFETGRACCNGDGFDDDEMVYVCVRPENIKISETPVEGFSIMGEMKEHIYVGSVVKSTVELPNGNIIKVNTHPEEEPIEIGKKVYIYWLDNKAVIMKNEADSIYNVIEDAVLK